MKRIIIVALLIHFGALSSILQGQADSSFVNYNEIGINISTVLSSFVGNDNGVFGPEDYPIIFKFHRPGISYRIGLGIKVDHLDEISEEDQEDLIFSEMGLRARFGLERNFAISSKFNVYYGIDLLGHYDYNRDIVSNVFDVTTITEKSYGTGIGPVIGFTYNLGKRVCIGTEGSFYNVYSYKYRQEEFQFNPEVNKERVSHGFQSSMLAPVHLYVMIRI